MSNIAINTPTFDLNIGTKKAPVAFKADLSGVALAAGKAGIEARKTQKKSMADLAKCGRFGTMAGYLSATFPKVLAAFVKRTNSRLEALRVMDGLTEDQQAQLKDLERDPLGTRKGFDSFVQMILDAHTGPTAAKLSKAQQEAMSHINDYKAPAVPAAPEAPTVPAAQ